MHRFVRSQSWRSRTFLGTACTSCSARQYCSADKTRLVLSGLPEVPLPNYTLKLKKETVNLDISSIDEAGFQAILDRCKSKDQIAPALLLASNIAKVHSQCAPVILAAALHHHATYKNIYLFRKFFTRFSAVPDGQLVLLNYAVWIHALSLGFDDAPFLDEVIALAKRSQEGNERTFRFYDVAMRTAMSHQTTHKERFLLTWQQRLLQAGFVPGAKEFARILNILCSLQDFSPPIEKLDNQLRPYGLSAGLCDTCIRSLSSQGRFEEAHKVFHHASRQKLGLFGSSIHQLLKHYIDSSQLDEVNSMLIQVEINQIQLTGESLIMLAELYGSRHDTALLIRISRFATGVMDPDSFWSHALKGAAKQPDFEAFYKSLSDFEDNFDQKCMEVCISLASSIEALRDIIRLAGKNQIKISAQGYCTLIRSLGRLGQLTKASEVLEACVAANTENSKAQSDFRWNYLLGLLEGHHFTELETTHALFVEQGTATASTWNLLLRSRLAANRVDDAMHTLETLERLRVPVENATAFEFMMTVLRHRSVGRNPNVLDPNDRRPYLADIKLAVKIGHKCMTLGGRVQPESWREVMKRLSLYGEFESLRHLTDWLIDHYSGNSTLYRMRRKYVSSRDLQHPLRRLIRDTDVVATVKRGFYANKARQAMELIVRWHRQGIYIDKTMVGRAIRTSIAYRAKSSKYDASDTARLETELNALLMQLS